MNKKLLKCALVGGVVLFLWGAFSWAVLPWHKMHMMKFTNEDQVASVVEDNAPMSGIYVLPNMMNIPPNTEKMAEAKLREKSELFMFAAVSVGGRSHSTMGAMVLNLILKVIAAWIVTWLLMCSRWTTFKHRVGFVTMVGLVIGLMATFPFWIWFGFPMGFTFACLLEIVIGWALAGCAISKVLK